MTRGEQISLARKCMLWVDRNGTVLDKGSSPFSAWLQMEYKDPGFSVYIRCTQSPYGNGYALIKVKVKNRLVFKAEGNYIGEPYFNKVTKYVSGTWEKKFNA